MSSFCTLKGAYYYSDYNSDFSLISKTELVHSNHDLPLIDNTRITVYIISDALLYSKIMSSLDIPLNIYPNESECVLTEFSL